MAEWRKFAARQKAKRRGKSQDVEESKVAEEIVVQRMSAHVSGKQQNTLALELRSTFLLSRTSFLFITSRTPVKSISGPKLRTILFVMCWRGNADHRVRRWLKFQTRKCFMSGLLNQKGNLTKKKIAAVR